MRGLLLGVAAALTLSGPVGASGATPSTAAGESPLVYVVIAVDTGGRQRPPHGELHTTFDPTTTSAARRDGEVLGRRERVDVLHRRTTFNFKVAPPGAGTRPPGTPAASATPTGSDRFALAGPLHRGGRRTVRRRLQLRGGRLPPDTKIYVVRDRDGDPDVARPLATYKARWAASSAGAT